MFEYLKETLIQQADYSGSCQRSLAINLEHTADEIFGPAVAFLSLEIISPTSFIDTQCIRKVFTVLHFFHIFVTLEPYSKIDYLFSPQNVTPKMTM